MSRSDAQARRTLSRVRAAGMLLALAAGLGALGAPRWVTAGAATAQGEPVAVALSGAALAPGVPAAALVVAAAALALTLVGRVGRFVVVALTLLAGVAVVGSVVGALAAPEVPAARLAGELTGVERLTEPVVVGAWPWLTAGVGVLVVVCAVWIAVASPVAAARSRRYERGQAHGPDVGPATDDHDTWDALTRGEDPT